MGLSAKDRFRLIGGKLGFGWTLLACSDEQVVEALNFSHNSFNNNNRHGNFWKLGRCI